MLLGKTKQNNILDSSSVSETSWWMLWCGIQTLLEKGRIYSSSSSELWLQSTLCYQLSLGTAAAEEHHLAQEHSPFPGQPVTTDGLMWGLSDLASLCQLLSHSFPVRSTETSEIVAQFYISLWPTLLFSLPFPWFLRTSPNKSFAH